MSPGVSRLLWPLLPKAKVRIWTGVRWSAVSRVAALQSSPLFHKTINPRALSTEKFYWIKMTGDSGVRSGRVQAMRCAWRERAWPASDSLAAPLYLTSIDNSIIWTQFTFFSRWFFSPLNGSDPGRRVFGFPAENRQPGDCHLGEVWMGHPCVGGFLWRDIKLLNGDLGRGVERFLYCEMK